MKLLDVAAERLPGHDLDLHLAGEGTRRGKTPYLVARRKPLSFEDYKRLESKEPKIYGFHYRQLRQPLEELSRIFKELQKVAEVLPPEV